MVTKVLSDLLYIGVRCIKKFEEQVISRRKFYLKHISQDKLEIFKQIITK